MALDNEDLNYARVDAACRAIRTTIERVSRTGDTSDSKPDFESIEGLTQAERDRASQMVALEVVMGRKDFGQQYHQGEWDLEVPPEVAEAFKQIDDNQ